MIQILLLNLVSIQLVNCYSYNLLKSDIVSTAAHTWKDSSNAALPATTTMCSYLKQPVIQVTSTTGQTLYNTYLASDNDQEVYVKVIFAGTWNNEAFIIQSDTFQLANVLLTSSTWTTTFCGIANTKTLVFKLTAPSTSLIVSGSSKTLKLKFIYSSSTSKTIYFGPILVYEKLADPVATNTYVENEQFSYFTSTSQSPSKIMPAFTLTTLDTILSQKFDVMTIGGTGSTVNYMIGGLNIWKTGTIQFSQALNPHYGIKFNFQVYQFDSSTTLTSSNFIVTITDTSTTTVIPNDKIKQLQAGNLYGGTGIDSIYYVEYEMDHTATTLQISFQLTITSFLGITNFNLISKNCPQYCQSCRSQGTCDACSSVTNRNLVTCQCKSQYYEDLSDHQCKACDYRCDTCQYDGVHILGNCVLCKYGFDINNQCTKCIYSYQYENTPDVKCENCAGCCLTCTGPSDKECLTFRPGWQIMPDNQCIAACPSNYFTYIQTPTRSLCIPCDSSCLTCADVQTKCTSCGPGYILLFNMCLVECPISTYRLNKDCTPCTDSSCQTCTESQCLLCLPNFYMSKVSKTCIATCDSSYYGDADPATRACKKCHQTCKECVGPAFTQCSQCLPQQYMLKLDNPLINYPVGICYKVCKEGYFPQGLYCVPCDPGCQFCTSLTVCQTCVAGYYLYNDFCVENCPSKMYPNTYVQKCLSCNAACIECFGGENYQCNSCSGGLSQYQGKCYLVCPTSTVALFVPAGSTTSFCLACTKGCDTCTGTNVNDCTQCSATFYSLYGQCFETCPTSYQANVENFKCEFCIQNCETCASGSCKLCATGYFFQDGLCNSDCTQHFYKSIDDRKCKECDVTCLTCSDSDIDNCLSCPSSYYFYFNNCLPQCPQGFYSDAQKICNACHSSCEQCNGPLINNCVSCMLTTYLYQSKCLATCPAGTYANDDLQQCLPCHSSCLTCQGGTANDCLTCPYLIERLKCITSCSENFVVDATGKECQPQYPITLTCSPQCATCSLQASNCNTCVASRNQNKPQCTCKKGFFEVQKPDCDPCLNKCATCAGTADACLTCKGNRIGATCLCPDYYYEDGVSENCPKCNYMCGLCANNICSTCADKRINPPTCSCPDGYYDNLEAVCQPCDLVCTTCKDFAENCVACKGIRINPPYCTCPAKFFDFQSQCIPCAFECNDCDSNGCSSCNGNMSGPFSGKCICKDGYSRKSIGSPYCTNCDLGVPYSLLLSGLSKISVDFGGPLALVTPGQTGCEQFFQASTLSTLGTSPTCAISDNAIVVTLGKYATIQVGHTFAFGSGFRLKICSGAFPNFRPSSLIIDPKTTDEQNTPYITFGSQQPKTICSEVKIAYTLGNTGSRNLLAFTWATSLPINYVNAQLSTLFAGIGPAKTYDSYITIPRLVLSQFTTFQFTVQLENFLNLQGSNSLYVSTLGPATADILFPDTINTYHRYEKAILNFSLSYYNCTLSGEMQDVLYTKIESDSKTIAEYHQDVYLEANSVLEFSYTVDEFIFNVGSNNISLTLSIPTQQLTITEFVNQEISEGTLVIKVAGGNRQVGDVATVVMTASVTDQDVGPLETDSFSYVIVWTCFDVLKGADCVDSFGKLLVYPSGKTITVEASALQQYNSYIFMATSEKGNKKSNGKSMIQVVEIDLPLLNSANATEEAQTIATTYNYYDDIQLSFSYQAANPDNLFYSGTIIYDQNVQSSFEFYSLTLKFKLLDYFTDLDTVKGNQITLRASIYNPSFVMPSLRNIILTFNLPPRNCTIIFNNGNDLIYELDTQVNMTIDSCLDDDQPLTYKVLFYNNNDTYQNDLKNGRFQNNIRLLDYQSNNTLLYTVPFVGSSGSINYTSLVVILIKDNQQGISNITYPINVYQNNKLNQTQLSKMIDHNDNLDSTIQVQDLVVSKLVQQTNCSEFKYSLIRKNDLLSTSDLTVEQQNSLFSQMTKLINDDEVAKQFDVNLQFLSYYEEMSNQNYEALQQLQSQSKSTLEQAVYLDNYFKTFDLFSALLLNSQYFNNTNDQVLDNLDIMKDQLIDFTVMNSDGFNMTNSNSQQIIKKASYKILNSIAGNILKEETVFRLLTDTTDQGSYEYYYNIFYVNPYLNEAKFPKADYFGAEVVYLRVVDESTQQVPVMLQPFTYTFTVSETYGTNKTICIQRVFTNWTSSDIETNLVDNTTIQCKTYYFYPFTLVVNSTVTNTTNNSTNTNSTTNTTNTDTNSTNTNNNSTNTNNNSTNNNTNTNSTNNVSNGTTPERSTLLISEPFYIYLMVLAGLIIILMCLAHFRDVRYAKVFDTKKANLEIIMTNPKDDTPDIKKMEELSYKEKSPHLEQLQASQLKPSKGIKAKILILNFHQLISVFYRDSGFRKMAFLYYVIRFLLIQASIFITYIYCGAAQEFNTISKEVILAFLFSPLVFSFYSFLLNYPFASKAGWIFKLILVIIGLAAVGLSMYRIADFIDENYSGDLDTITYILVASIVYDNLIYNPIVLMLTFVAISLSKNFEKWVFKLIPKSELEPYNSKEQDEVKE